MSKFHNRVILVETIQYQKIVQHWELLNTQNNMRCKKIQASTQSEHKNKTK